MCEIAKLVATICLVPYITGFTTFKLTTKKIWDKYYTAQPQLRTALEKKYKRLILH